LIFGFALSEVRSYKEKKWPLRVVRLLTSFSALKQFLSQGGSLSEVFFWFGAASHSGWPTLLSSFFGLEKFLP